MYSRRKRSFRDLSGGDRKSDQKQEYEHHGGSMGDYISTKRRKLEKQFNASSNVKSSIFSGHVMWINGYTQVLQIEMFLMVQSQTNLNLVSAAFE